MLRSIQNTNVESKNTVSNLHERLNYRLSISLLILLFVGGSWFQGWVLPPMEGGDEWLQVAYVEHLRTTGTLPDRTQNETGPVRQQSGQPPLTYALGALAANVLRLDPIDTTQMMDDLQASTNNWFTPPDRFNRLDNNNVFYLSNPVAAQPDVVAVVRTTRWLAPLYGVIAIVALYGAAWEVFRSRVWALTAAGLFAFNPTFLHMNSFLTTDGGAVMFGTLTLWLALRILRHGLTWRLALISGIVIGLGGLAKLSTLLVAPTVAVAALIAARRGITSWGALIVRGIALLVPVALTFGVWAAWGAIRYGDPLGTASHRFPGQVFDPPLGVGAVIARLPEVYLSYWGKFASAVYLHPMTYAALSLILLLAVVGWITAPRRALGAAQVDGAAMAGILISAVVVMFAGLWYWIATINFITGRLLFPAQGAIVILVTWGVYQLARRFPRWGVLLRGGVVALPATAGLIIAPAVIGAAYSPPLPACTQIAAMTAEGVFQHTAYDFDDTIRFNGWAADTTTIRSGDTYTIRMCWEPLQVPERAGAYSLKIVKDGVSVGERTTVLGLGRFDSAQWVRGYTVCDTLDVPVDVVEAGATYDLLLVMLDADTGAVDWQAAAPDGTPVPFPILGQVIGAD